MRGEELSGGVCVCVCVRVRVPTMVMGCHALPWRETDTHRSLAVEADLPRWGAHDD